MESRLTFRDKAGTVCWQKQLRDKYLDEGAPSVDLSLKNAIVRRVSRKLAEQVIFKYEWLGTMAQTGYHYGIFFGSYCAGVCCYASGGGTGGVAAHELFKVERGEFGVLARGACVHWGPPGANSKLVSFSSKLFGKDSGCKVAIAYSDSDAGEIGTIYQACNWIYIGRGASTRQWVALNGRIYDQKLAYDLKRRKGGTRADWANALRLAGWTEQASNPKHRYVYILDKKDKALIDRVERMRQPYPKRDNVRLASGSTLATSQGRQFDSDQAA